MSDYLGVPSGPLAKALRMLSQFPPTAWGRNGPASKLADKLLRQTKQHNPDLYDAVEDALTLIKGTSGTIKAANLRSVWAKAKSVHEQQFNSAGQLSKVDPAIAKSMVTSGPDSKDKISVSKKSVSAAKLKPSQTTMVLEKSLGMALLMIKTNKVGGDLGAIISSDNFIMDGHHRWSAAILAGGSSAQVGGYVAKIPGEKLVKVLNVITKGTFKKNRGNPGAGNLGDYTASKVKKMLEGFVEKGIAGKFPWSPDDVKKTLEKGFDSVEKGVEQISKNADLVTKTVPSWAPNRADMPVIDPQEVPSAAKQMQKGEVDWTPPYKKAASVEEVLAKAAHDYPELCTLLR